MRVIFNGLSAYRTRTGVSSYVANLLTALQELAGPEELTPFPDGWLAGLTHAANALFGGRSRRQGDHSAQRTAWRERMKSDLRHAAYRVGRSAFALACRRGQFDLYHEPNYIPWRCDLPTVVTVHDLSVLLYPEWHPPDRVAFFERHFHRRLRRCRHVITDAACVRDEVIRELGLPRERVSAVPLGIGREFRPIPESEYIQTLQAHDLPANFLLHLGTIEPRKNLLTLMQAYCTLPAELRDRCPLVLAGRWGWQVAETYRYFDETARHRNVRHLGYVAADVVPALCSAARALVFPTHYEGFGLPPLEMLACGGAVIASNADAVREAVGNCGWLLAPDDADGWRQALERVIRDDDWRDELRRGAVERAARYTWRRCAERTWDVYRAACAPSVRQAA